MNDIAAEPFQLGVDFVQSNRCPGANHRNTPGWMRAIAIHAAIEYNEYPVDIHNADRSDIAVAYDIHGGQRIIRIPLRLFCGKRDLDIRGIAFVQRKDFYQNPLTGDKRFRTVENPLIAQLPDRFRVR